MDQNDSLPSPATPASGLTLKRKAPDEMGEDTNSNGKRQVGSSLLSARKDSAAVTPAPSISGADQGVSTVELYSVCRKAKRYILKSRLSRANGLDGGMMQQPDRAKVCDILIKAGKSMGYPAVTIATAQLVYQRFQVDHRRSEVSPWDVAAACLLVAGKVEDTIKKLRDVVDAVHAVLRPDEPPPEYDSQEAVHRRNTVTYCEKLVLESMCFDFEVQHPFKYVVKFTKSLGRGVDLGRQAWGIAMDSHKTTLVLQFPAHTVAAGSVYLACMLMRSELPVVEGKALGPETMHSRLEDILDLCHQMLDFYIKGSTTDADLELYSRTKRELLQREQLSESAGTVSVGQSASSSPASPKPSIPSPMSPVEPSVVAVPAGGAAAIEDDDGDICGSSGDEEVASVAAGAGPPDARDWRGSRHHKRGDHCNYRYIFDSHRAVRPDASPRFVAG